jgi:cyclopropane fatty-acyl-phospholipid synthase-like methyltransferase
MTQFIYSKSLKYNNLDNIYSQCSGPGGLKLTEFMAEKMKIQTGKKLLDIGCNRGFQTCFLAKEYGTISVGIDPWKDRELGNPMVEHLVENAKEWKVENSILAIEAGVPKTGFASSSFDYVYSTTALEMVRVSQGIPGYLEALREIFRIMKPGAIFGLGEPMHHDISIPDDLLPYISKGEYPWKDCFRSLKATLEEILSVGFEILESGYAPDAQLWWNEFAEHDPFAKLDPQGDPATLKIDNGRWTSFGYVICSKPD